MSEKKLSKEELELKKSKKCLSIGAVFSFLAISVFVIALVLSFVVSFKDLSSSWYMIVLVVIAIAFFIIGMQLLKRGNKLKLDVENERQKREFEAEMKRILKKKEEEAKRKNDEK